MEVEDNAPTCNALQTISEAQVGSVVVVDDVAPIVVNQRVSEGDLAEYMLSKGAQLDQLFIWTAGWTPENLRGGPYHTAVNLECAEHFSGVSMMGRWDAETVSFATLAQEFSHQWLARAHFIDPKTKEVSDELIGRNGSHWSVLLDSDGSFQDGIDWLRGVDDRFRAGMKMRRWSRLDLWLMGLAKREEVDPMLLLRDAHRGSWEGEPLWKESPIPEFQFFQAVANPIQITIEDIEQATPAPTPRNGDPIRVAFVLLGDPTSEETLRMADELEEFRHTWTSWVQHKLWCRAPLCSAWEEDCSTQCEIECGDNRCDAPETPTTCPLDCGASKESCEQECMFLGRDCGYNERQVFQCLDTCAEPAALVRFYECRFPDNSPEIGDLCECAPLIGVP
jgi:hypothetical protein